MIHCNISFSFTALLSHATFIRICLPVWPTYWFISCTTCYVTFCNIRMKCIDQVWIYFVEIITLILYVFVLCGRKQGWIKDRRMKRSCGVLNFDLKPMTSYSCECCFWKHGKFIQLIWGKIVSFWAYKMTNLNYFRQRLQPLYNTGEKNQWRFEPATFLLTRRRAHQLRHGA